MKSIFILNGDRPEGSGDTQHHNQQQWCRNEGKSRNANERNETKLYIHDQVLNMKNNKNKYPNRTRGEMLKC